jgi:hypothetical protein
MPARIILLAVFLTLLISGIDAQPGRRLDTSMNFGKAGYKVFTNNKNPDRNNVTITPVGFENTARPATIDVKGRVNKAEVDDLNGDGFPELVLYLSPPPGSKKKTDIIAISSDKNQGMVPIYFPDVLDDPKLRIGYNGFDEFNLMEGFLMQRYPLYNTTDTANIVPTGLIRQIQYRVVVGDRGDLKFKVVRSYEFTKQH